LAQPRNNPMFQFDRYGDIEDWLREQWAGLFKELLSRSSSQRQLTSLSAQVTQLSEFNQTLKRYLEEVMVKVAPHESAELIEHESKRLRDLDQLLKLRDNDLIEFILKQTDLSISDLAQLIRDSHSLEDLIDRLIPRATDTRGREEIERLGRQYITEARRDLLGARAILGIVSPDEITAALNQTDAEPESVTRMNADVPVSPKKRGRLAKKGSL